MNLDEALKELEELRAFKKQIEADRIEQAFISLEHLLNTNYNPVMSIRAFRVIAECLLALRRANNG